MLPHLPRKNHHILNLVVVSKDQLIHYFSDVNLPFKKHIPLALEMKSMIYFHNSELFVEKKVFQESLPFYFDFFLEKILSLPLPERSL